MTRFQKTEIRESLKHDFTIAQKTVMDKYLVGLSVHDKCEIIVRQFMRDHWIAIELEGDRYLVSHILTRRRSWFVFLKSGTGIQVSIHGKVGSEGKLEIDLEDLQAGLDTFKVHEIMTS